MAATSPRSIWEARLRPIHQAVVSGSPSGLSPVASWPGGSRRAARKAKNGIVRPSWSAAPAASEKPPPAVRAQQVTDGPPFRVTPVPGLTAGGPYRQGFIRGAGVWDQPTATG